MYDFFDRSGGMSEIGALLEPAVMIRLCPKTLKPDRIGGIAG